MITIYTVMLVALGFLTASLFGFLLAPAYRRRAARLAIEGIRRSMPLNESEIRADKDRLRAEYAILVHDLRSKIEHVTLAAARRDIEINRRDAVISRLEGEIDGLKVSLEEHENARRVLERTVSDRLPRVEYRLGEAKRLLEARDSEIAELTQSAGAQSRAMEEASQINAQQRDELLRANAALTTRVARNRDSLGDPRFDGEVALRSEVESLRAKAREQALLITRLQALAARGAGAGHRDGGAPGGLDGGIERLREDLAEAEATLRSARNPDIAERAAPAAVETELRALKAANRDQAVEIARLAAALQSWESADRDPHGLKDSKIALKARLSSLQAQTEQQVKTIQTLRVENAAANERLARQAANFRDEMRRIGAGTIPVAGPPRAEPSPRSSRTLSERIQERPRSADAGQAQKPAEQDSARVSGFLKALSGSEPAPDAPGESAAEPAGETARKPRLLDRLTGLDKPSA